MRQRLFKPADPLKAPIMLSEALRHDNTASILTFAGGYYDREGGFYDHKTALEAIAWERGVVDALQLVGYDEVHE